MCMNNKIIGYPTILFHSNNGNIIEYKGDRTTNDIIKFVRNVI